MLGSGFPVTWHIKCVKLLSRAPFGAVRVAVGARMKLKKNCLWKNKLIVQ